MTDLYLPRPERLFRFRFGLRTLFVLLTLAGCAMGWLGVKLKWIRDRQEALGKLAYGYVSPDGASPASPWSIKILGEPGYGAIMALTKESMTMEELQRIDVELTLLFPEAAVSVSPVRPFRGATPTH